MGKPGANQQDWHPKSFVGRLDPKAQNALSRLGTTKIVQPGVTFLRQGEPGGVVFLVLGGRVNITHTAENGTESLLAIRHPGDLVGEMAVLRCTDRGAAATARDRAILLSIPGRDFLRFVDTQAGVGTALGMASADRLDEANTYRNDAAAYSVDIRLARALLYQCERMCGPDVEQPAIDLKQAELAMLIGAKEGTVQKALTQSPQLSGLVESARARVVILDRKKLAILAELQFP